MKTGETTTRMGCRIVVEVVGPSTDVTITQADGRSHTFACGTDEARIVAALLDPGSRSTLDAIQMAAGLDRTLRPDAPSEDLSARSRSYLETLSMCSRQVTRAKQAPSWRRVVEPLYERGLATEIDGADHITEKGRALLAELGAKP